MTDDDARMEAGFRVLRRADDASAPPFDRVWAAARRRLRPRRPPIVAWAGAVAIAVALGAVALLVRPARSPATSILEWRSPTAFLLQTPGAELLGTLPSLDRWPAPDAAWPGSTPSPSPPPKEGDRS